MSSVLKIRRSYWSRLQALDLIRGASGKQTEQTAEEEEVHVEVVEDDEQAEGVEEVDLRKRRGTLGSVNVE